MHMSFDDDVMKWNGESLLSVASRLGSKILLEVHGSASRRQSEVLMAALLGSLFLVPDVYLVQASEFKVTQDEDEEVDDVQRDAYEAGVFQNEVEDVSQIHAAQVQQEGQICLVEGEIEL